MTKTENTSVLKAPVLSISRFVAMQMEAAPAQEWEDTWMEEGLEAARFNANGVHIGSGWDTLQWK